MLPRRRKEAPPLDVQAVRKTTEDRGQRLRRRKYRAAALCDHHRRSPCGKANATARMQRGSQKATAQLVSKLQGSSQLEGSKCEHVLTRVREDGSVVVVDGSKLWRLPSKVAMPFVYEHTSKADGGRSSLPGIHEVGCCPHEKIFTKTIY